MLGSVDNKKENDIMFLFKREAMLYGLQDNEWARIKDSLPGKESGRSAKDNRKFMAAVMWIVEHRGAAEYGKWSNKRFMRWARAGVWQMIFWQLYR